MGTMGGTEQRGSRRFGFGRRWLAIVIGSGLALVLAFPVQAQDEPADDEAAAEEVGPAAGKGVETIVVTARKREERLQEVPIAVTSLSGANLDDKKIDDTLQLQFEVPNLFFSKTNFTASNLQIRGIGSAVVAASGEPAVGIHVNTVPQTASRIFEQEFFDVERIEVLRGPQGTLFGRNSTGGSFNVYTRKPGLEYENTGELEIGNYSSVRFKGAVNVPFNDTVQMRVAGMVHDRDGWIENLGTGNTIDDRTLGAIRGSFRVNVTDYTTVDAMVSYFKEKDSRSRIGKQLCVKDTNPSPFSIGCTDGPLGFGTLASHATLGGILESYQLALPPPNGFGLTPLYPIGVDANANAINPPDLFTHNSRIDPQYEADEILAILDVTHELTDLTLSWVTGYQNTSVDSQQDYNMVQPSLAWDPAAIATISFLTGLPTLGPPAAPTHLCLGAFGCVDRSFAQDQSRAESEQISTEVRAVSDYAGKLNFTAGAIFTYFTTRTDYFVYFSGAEVVGALLASPGFPFFGVWNPELNHYNNETNPARTKSVGVFGELYYDITDATKFTLGARYTYDKKTVRSRQYLLTSTSPGGQVPLFINQDNSWHNGTGVASLKHDFDFDFTDQSMVYASVSRGFKPGGFNPPAVAGSSVPETFDPEIVWAYELGTKNQFWESRVQANLTGFFYDYEGYQISKIVARTSVNENIDAYIWGLEAEFVVVPIDDLRLEATLAYLGSEIQSGTSIDPADPAAGVPGFNNLKDLATAANVVCPAGPPGPGGVPTCAGPTFEGFAKSLAGRELPNTPDIQINLTAEYTFKAPWEGYLTPRINYYWQNEMFGRFFNEVRDEIDSWSQANAGIRWNNEENSVYVDLWVRNFTDNDDITAHYFTDASSGNFTNVFVLQPRTWGITAGLTF